MKIRKIFFDLDGTLANFDHGLIEMAGIMPMPQDDTRPPEYDDTMWDAIRKTDHFYRNLKPMDGAIELFMHIYKKYGSCCEILTGIPKEKRRITDAAQDKRDWVKQYLPEGIIIHTVHREEKKEFCTGACDILIDDLKDNIMEWESCGGTGILYTTADDVRKAFDLLIGT